MRSVLRPQGPGLGCDDHQDHRELPSASGRRSGRPTEARRMIEEQVRQARRSGGHARPRRGSPPPRPAWSTSTRPRPNHRRRWTWARSPRWALPSARGWPRRSPPSPATSPGCSSCPSGRCAWRSWDCCSLISGPSMVIAWLKLSRRNLGPAPRCERLGDQRQARLNVPSGASLTGVANAAARPRHEHQGPFRRKAQRLAEGGVMIVIVAGFLFSPC